MLVPLSDADIRNISNNVIAACKDISKLNKRGYQFISCLSGFIAHYNLDGFKCYYSEGLVKDLKQSWASYQYGNFMKGDRDYDYIQSKRKVMLRVMEVI